METVDIVGENYFGQWTKTRSACRGIVIKDGKMLLSYETKTGQWMLPGGGIEDGESDTACCIREVEEETGILVEPSKCFLMISEYYEDERFVNLYFVCHVVGEGKRNPTRQEIAVGMEPQWMPVEEIKAIFGTHQDYAETDEMRRGMYLREYTALCALENHF